VYLSLQRIQRWRQTNASTGCRSERGTSDLLRENKFHARIGIPRFTTYTGNAGGLELRRSIGRHTLLQIEIVCKTVIDRKAKRCVSPAPPLRVRFTCRGRRSRRRAPGCRSRAAESWNLRRQDTTCFSNARTRRRSGLIRFWQVLVHALGRRVESSLDTGALSRS
jgi:hypothetical protein